jgi:hypothetical protein
MRTLVFSSKDFSICKLGVGQKLPIDLTGCLSSFLSFSKTESENSLILESSYLSKDMPDLDPDWNMFYVKGPVSFSAVAVLSPLLERLAEKNISIFVVSTFDTDYVFFKKNLLEAVINELKENYLLEIPEAAPTN